MLQLYITARCAGAPVHIETAAKIKARIQKIKFKSQIFFAKKSSPRRRNSLVFAANSDFFTFTKYYSGLFFDVDKLRKIH